MVFDGNVVCEQGRADAAWAGKVCVLYACVCVCVSVCVHV